MRNTAVMSIDVEDWFQVENLRPAIARDSWHTRQLRVERNMDRMLQLMLDAPGEVRATCFVLGWIAERVPALVRRIAEAGHEIASHGYGHQLLTELRPDTFRADILRSKSLLEDIAGVEVSGYRAPNFSMTEWAIPILEEVGFSYDSSVFPTLAHDRYGRISGVRATDAVVQIAPRLVEVPVSCLALGDRGIPWGGGGYFRLIPYRVFRQGVASVLRSGRPYVFYIHPWEIDPDQPRVRDLGRTHRMRHYVGLNRCERRFAWLLRDFRWTSIADLLETTVA
jgi:polysaccharide deacetylase family protein (PEP-CTERM system associated)